MALDDYLEPEVAVVAGVAAAVTAAVISPPVRQAVRRGLVYGLAGLLMAGDRITAAAREVAHSAEQAAASAGSAETATTPAPVPAREA
jgi:hypothetical protein